jgi:uncharacterized protein
MQPAEQYRVIAFLSVVATVFILAAGVVVRLILQRLGKIKLSNSRGQVFLRRAILGLALSGILCIAYAYFIEPYWPSVTHVAIKSSKLPAGARPIRLVLISDLHSDPQPRLEERLPDIIAAQKPDVILFAGDTLNSPMGLPVLKQCLTKLAKTAPTYAVKGNSDVWDWYKINMFDGTGVQELKGTSVKVDAGGTPFWISGVPVGSEERIGPALESIAPGDFSILLYHYPDQIKKAAARKVDLYCAGHTHGGQVALPFYGALVTLSKFGKQFESGLYRVDETWLYVNRGIGMAGGNMPRVRFCARPEVTVIEISPG